jgi:hypothetical protein
VIPLPLAQFTAAKNPQWTDTLQTGMTAGMAVLKHQ